jgi:hypothetical protein
MNAAAQIKARRITGGATIRITRADGREHRYRVGLRRYRRLADILGVSRNVSGSFTRHGFDVRLRSVAGLADSRRWLDRFWARPVRRAA